MRRKELFACVMEMAPQGAARVQKMPEASGLGSGGGRQGQKSPTSQGMRPSQVKVVLAGRVVPGRPDVGTRRPSGWAGSSGSGLSLK